VAVRKELGPPPRFSSARLRCAASRCRSTPLIIAAPFSTIMIVGALVLVELTAGITEAWSCKFLPTPGITFLARLRNSPADADMLHEVTVTARSLLLAWGLHGRSCGRRGEPGRSERDEHRSFLQTGCCCGQPRRTAIMSDG